MVMSKTGVQSGRVKKSSKQKGRKNVVLEIKNGALPLPKKPPKFSYIIEGLVAGHGRPSQHGHVQFLVDNGFRYLVTLTMNKPKALHEYPGEGIEWIHIPIQDETPPSIVQIRQFIQLVDRAEKEQVAISVHCAWGRGRTGTMLACYLAQKESLDAQSAIDKIRQLRPGSIDTVGQERAVEMFVLELQSNC